MSEWETDKQWSDIFIPEIKSILGKILIGVADVEEDQLRNTDLIVLALNAYRIGCRVRKHEFFTNYPNDFTIRYSRPSGVSTEFDKIMEGWGDYLFYGFSNKKDTHLIAWRLITLKRFRDYVNWYKKENAGKPPGQEIPNKDGSSFFLAFDARDKYCKALISNSWED